MRMGRRLRHLHLLLMLGVSLFIPLFLAYSLYVDLSGTVLLSSDMSFETPDDDDSLTCENDFKVFAPTVPSILLLPGTHLGDEAIFFWPSFTSQTQIAPVLRC